MKMGPLCTPLRSQKQGTWRKECFAADQRYSHETTSARSSHLTPSVLHPMTGAVRSAPGVRAANFEQPFGLHLDQLAEPVAEAPPILLLKAISAQARTVE